MEESFDIKEVESMIGVGNFNVRRGIEGVVGIQMSGEVTFFGIIFNLVADLLLNSSGEST